MLWPDTWDDPSLRAACRALGEQRELAFLLLENDLTFEAWGATGAMASDLPASVVLLLAAGPLQPACLLTWREGLAGQNPPVGFTFVRLPSSVPPAGWACWMRRSIGTFGLKAAEEDVGLAVGSQVRLPDPAGTAGSDRGYDPFVLAIPPDGPLAPVLRRLDSVRRAFEGMRPQLLDDMRRRVHTALDELLADPTPERQAALRAVIERAGFMRADRTQLPRVLLLGESGTGKTVLARYLASHQVEDLPFERVPIPEYLGREEHFELDVFGYGKGAYTGAREEGSRGELAELIGGVVFFDEIGDANPTIQAKLLAYLDNYVVKPRGLPGAGYYCPALVVAATNRDVYATDGGLRGDLLNRFNEIIRVPSLTDRASEIDLQVDLLLQLEAQGSGNPVVKAVGEEALARIRQLDFRGRNFRLLERIVSSACRAARSERRSYIAAQDIPWEPPAKSDGAGTDIEHEVKFALPETMADENVEALVGELAATLGASISEPRKVSRAMRFFDTTDGQLLRTNRVLRCVSGFAPPTDGHARFRYDYKPSLGGGTTRSALERSFWEAQPLGMNELARKCGLASDLREVLRVSTTHIKWTIIMDDGVPLDVSADRLTGTDGPCLLHELELGTTQPRHAGTLARVAAQAAAGWNGRYPLVSLSKYQNLAQKLGVP